MKGLNISHVTYWKSMTLICLFTL